MDKIFAVFSLTISAASLTVGLKNIFKSRMKPPGQVDKEHVQTILVGIFFTAIGAFLAITSLYLLLT